MDGSLANTLAIAFWDFLFKIKRIDSPVCCFGQKVPETIIHIFCKCDLVKPVWQEIGNIFLLNTEFDSCLILKRFWNY